MRENCAELFASVQDRICAALEEIDAAGRFHEDVWDRSSSPSSGRITKPGIGSGGGKTRVLEGGRIFEKAGVNFSRVEGLLPPEMSLALLQEKRETPFFATGISVVVHPLSPHVPTTHANYRYFESGEKSWFGGGADLTPYILKTEDAAHFHLTYKNILDDFDTAFYPAFKKHCDEYFYIPHRNESRGVGGIFFDYIGRDDASLIASFYPAVCRLAPAFLGAYLPIVERNKDLTWTAEEKKFQLRRRGRYVEFNLTYDRGTHFGLQTGGRIESILMSLPPEVRWDYDVKTLPGTPEAELLEVLQNPREWASLVL